MQASETPPIPTSDKTGPISEEEERERERRTYLELYKQSSGILD